MRDRELDKMDRRLIQASSPSFKGNERKYVLDCLDRGWITQGKYVRQFEEMLADYYSVKYVIVCSSGTAALHLAFLGAGINTSSTVIVPALTYVATANAAKYCGAEVLFADIRRDDWCIDTRSIIGVSEGWRAKNLNQKIDLVVPVHLYDAMAHPDINPSKVMFDSAQAVNGKPLGYGCLAYTYSFYASKVIGTGEGGAVLTNNKEIAERAKLYRGQGATIPGRYHHSVVGYNYRMTDLQAAVGLAQLERIEENLSIRREIVNRYRSNLANSPITLQGGQRASGWTCAVLVPKEYDRDKIMGLLLESGIETRPFFEPIPSLPPYQDCGPVPPVAAEISKRGICLPTHTEMSIQDVDYVSSRLLEAVS